MNNIAYSPLLKRKHSASYIYHCVCVCVCVCVYAQLCLTLWPHELWLARFLCPWKFPVKNTGVGCHSLFQGIFLTRGSSLGLLHCRQSLPSEPPGKYWPLKPTPSLLPYKYSDLLASPWIILTYSHLIVWWHISHNMGIFLSMKALIC